MPLGFIYKRKGVIVINIEYNSTQITLLLPNAAYINRIAINPRTRARTSTRTRARKRS